MQFSSWNPCQSSNLWLKCHFDKFPSNYVASHEATPDGFWFEGSWRPIGNTGYKQWV